MSLYTEFLDLLFWLDDCYCFQTPVTIKFYELLSVSEFFSGNCSFFTWLDCYKAVNPTTHSTPFILKLTLCLVTLIVIRGGVPRYRYDLLTKMGWTKFLLLVLTVLLSTLMLLYVL